MEGVANIKKTLILLIFQALGVNNNKAFWLKYILEATCLLYLCSRPRITMEYHNQRSTRPEHFGHIEDKLSLLTFYYDFVGSCFPGFSFSGTKYFVWVVHNGVVIF